MNIIRAQFMHQHKDKAVYEREILLDTPSLNHYYTTSTIYLEFEVSLLLAIESDFVKRWYKRFVETHRNTHVTRRSLRFLSPDGTVLYELSKRPLKASMRIAGRDLSTIHILCVVEKDEIKELTKIFFK